jgi:hypothetical protein
MGDPQLWEIYLVTCRDTGKQYVGQARRTAYARWGWTISTALTGRKDFPLHRAIREHGPHAFSLEVIAACRSQNDADWLEALLIEQHGTRVPSGYNVTAGRGGLGVRLTDEQRARRREVSKAHWADPEQRQTHTAAIRKSQPQRTLSIKAAYSVPERRAAQIKQLDDARDKRLRGFGCRSKRTIHDQRQPSWL